MNEEHCRLCDEVIDENGGDGLCEACFFAHADPAWLQEHYPWRQDEPDDSDVLDDWAQKKPVARGVKRHRQATNE